MIIDVLRPEIKKSGLSLAGIAIIGILVWLVVTFLILD